MASKKLPVALLLTLDGPLASEVRWLILVRVLLRPLVGIEGG